MHRRGRRSHRTIDAEDGFGIERDVLGVCAALHVAAPRAVDENAAHRLGGNSKEVGAVLPLHTFVVDQSQVGFVHQRRGLQAVASSLAFQVVVRQTVELVVHDWGQLRERALVPVASGTEKPADLSRDHFTDARVPMHRAVSGVYASRHRSPVPLPRSGVRHSTEGATRKQPGP